MPSWFDVLATIAVVTLIVIAQGLFGIKDALLKVNERLDELCEPERERKEELDKIWREHLTKE